MSNKNGIGKDMERLTKKIGNNNDILLQEIDGLIRSIIIVIIAKELVVLQPFLQLVFTPPF